MMGRKFGNITDEGIDARATYQFLFAMFGSFLLFPFLGIILVALSYFFFPIPWDTIGASVVSEIFILQISIEFILTILLFWLSAVFMVVFCDFVFDTRKAIIRNSLRKQSEGKELENLNEELLRHLA